MQLPGHYRCCLSYAGLHPGAVLNGIRHARLQYDAGIGAISISNILSFIPVTIAGFGTRELVFAEIWELSQYPKEIALSVSTAYFMVTYLGSLIIGGVVYLSNLKQLYRPGEIRKMNDVAYPHNQKLPENFSS